MSDDSGFDPDFIAKLEKELNEAVQGQINEAHERAKVQALEGAAKVLALSDGQRARAIAEMFTRNVDEIMAAYEHEEYHVAAMWAVLFMDDIGKFINNSVERSENWILNQTYGDVQALTAGVINRRLQIVIDSIAAAGTDA